MIDAGGGLKNFVNQSDGLNEIFVEETILIVLRFSESGVDGLIELPFLMERATKYIKEKYDVKDLTKICDLLGRNIKNVVFTAPVPIVPCFACFYILFSSSAWHLKLYVNSISISLSLCVLS